MSESKVVSTGAIVRTPVLRKRKVVHQAAEMGHLWTAKRLARAGMKLNAYMREDVCDYTSKELDEVTFSDCIAYAVLAVANHTRDRTKRAYLEQILHSSAEPTTDTLKGLGVRMWSPVKKAVAVYRPLISQSNRPTPLLLKAWREEENHTWATLMPVKVYVLAQFHGKETKVNATWNAVNPFGRFVAKAYAIYTGTNVGTQPTITQHKALHRFERTWAMAAGDPATPLDINSGLYQYGYDLEHGND